jgi:hypothetical protein
VPGRHRLDRDVPHLHLVAPGEGPAGRHRGRGPGVRESGEKVPRGTAGLVAIKGPIGCTYWRKPDRQAEYVRFGGWNVTGDVYVQDEEGYFTYQCRSDDMIVTGGYAVRKPGGLRIEVRPHWRPPGRHRRGGERRTSPAAAAGSITSGIGPTP